MDDHTIHIEPPEDEDVELARRLATSAFCGAAAHAQTGATITASHFAHLGATALVAADTAEMGVPPDMHALAAAVARLMAWVPGDGERALRDQVQGHFQALRERVRRKQIEADRAAGVVGRDLPAGTTLVVRYCAYHGPGAPHPDGTLVVVTGSQHPAGYFVRRVGSTLVPIGYPACCLAWPAEQPAPLWRRGLFSMDGLDQQLEALGELPFTAWTRDEYWNGFSVPYFERGEVVRLMVALNSASCNDPEGWQQQRVGWASADTVRVRDDQSETLYPALHLQGLAVPVWDIGGRAWVWYEITGSETKGPVL